MIQCDQADITCITGCSASKYSAGQLHQVYGSAIIPETVTGSVYIDMGKPFYSDTVVSAAVTIVTSGIDRAIHHQVCQR